jgi:hypothetical protein
MIMSIDALEKKTGAIVQHEAHAVKRSLQRKCEDGAPPLPKGGKPES